MSEIEILKNVRVQVRDFLQLDLMWYPLYLQWHHFRWNYFFIIYYTEINLRHKNAKLTKISNEEIVTQENESGSGFEVVLATDFVLGFVIVFVVDVLSTVLVV